MATQRTRVDLDDAEVLIKGKVGGRLYEYTGAIDGFVIEVDDDIDEDLWRWRSQDYLLHKSPTNTYSFTFVKKDGKAITVKQHKKVVKRTARTEFGVGSDMERVRAEVGAPVEAEMNLFEDYVVEFSWEEEV